MSTDMHSDEPRPGQRYLARIESVSEDDRDLSNVDEHGRDMTPGPWVDTSGRDWLS